MGVRCRHRRFTALIGEFAVLHKATPITFHGHVDYITGKANCLNPREMLVVVAPRWMDRCPLFNIAVKRLLRSRILYALYVLSRGPTFKSALATFACAIERRK
jgi:hypothetical protein